MWTNQPVFLKIKKTLPFIKNSNVKYINPMIHQDHIVPMYRLRKNAFFKETPCNIILNCLAVILL
jgi:hypothetical protein